MRQFVKNHNPRTEGTYYHSPAFVDGVLYRIGLMDTSGMEEDNVLLEEKIRDGDAFILMYRVHSRGSFNSIKTYHEQICRLKGNVRNPVIIVGNTSNETDQDFDGAKVEVSREDAYSLAAGFGCGIMEVSVRKWIDMKEVVSCLVRGLRDANAPPPPYQYEARLSI
jgi:GTPase KRas